MFFLCFEGKLPCEKNQKPQCFIVVIVMLSATGQENVKQRQRFLFVKGRKKCYYGQLRK